MLARVRLFEGMEPAERSAVLDCLGARVRTLAKDDRALAAGDRPDQVGILLEGSLRVVREDAEGGRMLIAPLLPGELFAEALCCAGVRESPVSVVADSEATVMLIVFSRMLRTCSQACGHHRKLVENMLRVIAAKSLELQGRIELLSGKTIRTRLMRYLSAVAARQGRDFSIPFNREELADYLAVDRSALSRELARLKGEGVIDYWKNRFKLL